MTMPSTVVFAAGDVDYVASMNQMITDINAMYNQYLTTLAPAYFVGTSTTSNTVGTGSKTWTVAEASARAYTIGTTVRVADSANAANYLEGQVTSYTHPTLIINVSATGGSGTKTAWSIGLGPAAAAITGMGVGSATSLQVIRANSGATAIEGRTLVASDIASSAYGTLAAVTVQAALQELVDECMPKTGGTFTGEVIIPKLSLGAVGTETYSATPTINLSTGNQYRVMTLTGNITTLTLTAPDGPGVFQIEFIQDGTGSRLLSAVSPALKWPASYSTADKTLTTTASARDLLVLRWNGTDYVAQLIKGIA
jgi:hypothetical protein